MKLLILGGTGFVGPRTLQAARAVGMTVTLFNRGNSIASLPVDVEVLHGDRDPDKGSGLAALQNRKWDAVVDLCGYVPRMVGASARLLARSVGHYIFISTISVYSDLSQANISETSEVGSIHNPDIEEITGASYGPLKVLCERAVEAAMPARATVIRPGLIVGPGDPTDRFTYWPIRMSRGGEMLAPGDKSAPVQFIDVRDLAAFIIMTVQKRVMGTMNAVGPGTPMTIEQLLGKCRAVTESTADLIWVSSDFLLNLNLKPWSDLPMWVPDTPDVRGFARINNHRALESGLHLRPVEETILDTTQWFAQQRTHGPLKAGPVSERELEILNAFKGL